jgi:alpha-tubulin suppressor-like RCC1 family protein
MRRPSKLLANVPRAVMATALGLAFSITAGAAGIASTTAAGAVPSRHHLAQPLSGASKAASGSAVAVDTWGDNSAGELGNASLTGSLLPAAANTSAAGTASVTAIAAGGRHDLALLSNGTVLAWGDDSYGQLGNGKASANDDAETPALVKDLSGVVAVAAGGEYSLALLSNGTVEAWGDNFVGQLGDGTKTDSDVPVLVKGLTDVKAISAGDQFSLAVLGNGTVKSWGINDDAQLGDDSERTSDVPVAVTGLTGVHAVSAGTFHALALLDNGTVEAWGDNSDGELGDGNTQGLSAVPVPVDGLSGVTAVAAGNEHSAALLSNGMVDAWGDNSFFELGRPQANSPGGVNDSDVPLAVPGVSDATAIAAGAIYSLALSNTGTVVAWGDNTVGQLGDNSDATNAPVVNVKGLTGVTAIAAGGDQSVALVAAPTAAQPNLAGLSGPPSSPWRVVAGPNKQNSAGLSFRALSASSPSDAWAVGSTADGQATAEPAGEHWNGTTWTVATFPPGPQAPSVLSGVDDLSPTNAWAVGTSGDATLIEHWNGTTWNVVASPNPGAGTPTSFDQLRGVSGTNPDDLWAVGAFFDPQGSEAMLLLHWNGTTWTFFAPADPTGPDQFGVAVTVIWPDDAWAVGDDVDGTVSQHFNGTKWTVVNTPILKVKSSVNELTGITNAGANDIWASGFDSSGGAITPYVLHSTGAAWTLVKIPNAGSVGIQPNGVTALSATDIWVNGVTVQGDGGSLALSDQFNGTTWSIVPALEPGQQASLPVNTFDFLAAAGTGTLLAIGGQSAPGLLLHQQRSDLLVEEDTTAG